MELWVLYRRDLWVCQMLVSSYLVYPYVGVSMHAFLLLPMCDRPPVSTADRCDSQDVLILSIQ